MSIAHTIFYIVVFMFFVIGVSLSVTLLSNTEPTVYMILNPIRYGINRKPFVHSSVIKVPDTVDTDFDKSTALACCQFIENLYAYNISVDNMEFCRSFKYDASVADVENIANSSFGCIYYAKNTLFVVFRGTEVRLQEWMDNLKYYQVSAKHKLAEKPPTFMSKKIDMWDEKSFIEYHRDIDIMVHAGWLGTTCHVMDIVSEVINEKSTENDSIKVVFTGHSMGGCISTLLAAEMATLYPNISCILYTFASPRVGNRAFVDYINNLENLRIHRVVNLSDTLPDLIAAVAPNFSDPKKPYFYNHCGELYYFDVNLLSIYNNHTIVTYRNHFEQ